MIQFPQTSLAKERGSHVSTQEAFLLQVLGNFQMQKPWKAED